MAYMMSIEALAWFWMSEGSVCIYVQRRPKRGYGYALVPEATIANTDRTLLNAASELLSKCTIKHRIAKNGGNTADSCAIRIAPTSVNAFLKLLKPYVIGRKTRHVQIVTEYLDNRLTGVGHASLKGRYLSGLRLLNGLHILAKIRLLNTEGGHGKGRNYKYNIESVEADIKSKMPNPALFDGESKEQLLKIAEKWAA